MTTRQVTRDRYGRAQFGDPVTRRLWVKTIALDDAMSIESEGARFAQKVRVVTRYDGALLDAARNGGYGGWTLELDGYEYQPSELVELPEYRREYMAIVADRSS